MRLTDLDKYQSITIQCHDNPDADTIGAGYGLYCYFKSLGKEVRLIYSGRSEITKTNLKLMIETLDIPIEYVPANIPAEAREPIVGLLLTVDCQHGAGNVTRMEASEVAVIDHHPVEIVGLELSRIQPNLGSCSTLVWNMLREVGFDVNENEKIGTALYYGLYMDTNQFAELSNPLDMDMCETVSVNKRLMTRYRNANISLRELELAGIAMIRHDYNDDYRFAVIKSQPCDPNLLGLISDFLLQVAEVDTCVVFNENPDGFKLSVRSCIKEVNANELAAFLTEGVGSGGGHFEKAGGFISKKLYEQKYPTLHSEAYINNRMTEYFDSFEIIYAKDVEVDLAEYALWRRRKEAICFLKADELFPLGTRVSLRTSGGNTEFAVEEDTYITMERDGTIHAMSREIFVRYMEETQQQVPADYCDNIEYEPIMKNLTEGRTYLLTEHCKMAMPKETFRIYVKELDKSVKLFPKWNADKYMCGLPGDYLVVSEDDLHNIYIEQKENFDQKFEAVSGNPKCGKK